MAILEDNPNDERVKGLNDTDIMEIYQSSVEIMSLDESVSLQSTAIS